MCWTRSDRGHHQAFPPSTAYTQAAWDVSRLISSQPASSFLYIRTCDVFANTEFPFSYPSNRVYSPRIRLFPRSFPSQTQAESPLVFPSISISHGKRQCDAICRLSIDIGFLFFGGVSFFPDSFSSFVFQWVLSHPCCVSGAAESTRRENNIVAR